MSQPRVLIAAGEASGDALGAALVERLRGRVRFEGVAGPRMRAVGVVPLARAEDLSAVGLVEVAGVLPRAARALLRVEGALRDPPAAVLTIDAPELGLRIAARARRRGVPTLHWVCPQHWAWRPGRLRSLGSAVDEVLCLFPWEPEALRAAGVEATFVGHPAVERSRGWRRPPDEPPCFGLAPGSRTSEIARLWPIFREAGERLRAHGAIRVAVAPGRTLPGLDPSEATDTAGLAGCGAVLAASGTVTLELAAAGVPPVVAYRLHPLTWRVARTLVRTRHVALPNLLAGARVVPEFLQRLDPGALAAACRVAAEDRDRLIARLDPFVLPLGEGDPVGRVAERLLARL